MACQNCHQDSWVTIGVKKYCTACGSLQQMGAPTPARVDSVARPIAIKKPVSAQALHGSSALAGGGVLDLRQPKPQPKPVVDPILVVAPQPTPVPVLPPTPQPQPEVQPTPAPQPIPEPKPQPTLGEMAAELSNPIETTATPKKEPKQHPSRRPMSIAAGTLAVLILGGYIWMSNYNNLSIRTAGQRAGIVASLPQYTPSDYKLSGPISYGTGFVSFNLNNKKESTKSIAVIQRKSDWDSASLLELYVSPKTKDYVARETQGLKIYLYGDGEATWVNHGIQYVVQADSTLSSEDIVKMAASL